ncbi:hypothetical protein H0H81_004322 [Sphagnurus paluster]|uniref:Uncharacterized protein n=1 Tax=Sphagnurus paluster TaxID=117069 RepID=A0A9P7FLL4_9AGAR|nr:hypothetical protein H0H81_004322 [Sphagnurus paluster]
MKGTKRKTLPGDVEEPAAKKKQGGHVNGVPNYPEEDVEALLDIVEARLLLVKMKKPTGQGTIPPDVARALEIEELILAEAETCELDDSEIVDQDVVEISSEDEEEPAAAVTQRKDIKAIKEEPKTYTVSLSRPMAERKREQPAPRKHVNQSWDFLSSISSALNPSAQAA